MPDRNEDTRQQLTKVLKAADLGHLGRSGT